MVYLIFFFTILVIILWIAAWREEFWELNRKRAQKIKEKIKKILKQKDKH